MGQCFSSTQTVDVIRSLTDVIRQLGENGIQRHVVKEWAKMCVHALRPQHDKALRRGMSRQFRKKIVGLLTLAIYKTISFVENCADENGLKFFPSFLGR
jgi:hypothetical protein